MLSTHRDVARLRSGSLLATGNARRFREASRNEPTRALWLDCLINLASSGAVVLLSVLAGVLPTSIPISATHVAAVDRFRQP